MKREPKTTRKTKVTKVAEPTHIVSLGAGKYYCKLTPDGVERAKATWLPEDEAEGQAEFLRRMGHPDVGVEPIKGAAKSGKTPVVAESVVAPEKSTIRRRTTSRPPTKAALPTPTVDVLKDRGLVGSDAGLVSTTAAGRAAVKPAPVSADTLASSRESAPVVPGKPAPVSAELPVAHTVTPTPERKYVLRLPSGGYFSSKVEVAAVPIAQAERLSKKGAERIAEQLRNMSWHSTIEPAPEAK